MISRRICAFATTTQANEFWTLLDWIWEEGVVVQLLLDYFDYTSAEFDHIDTIRSRDLFRGSRRQHDARNGLHKFFC
jgi:hypothetical protein